jgi:hypothetical protein
MGFTALEDFVFCLIAELVDFRFGNEIVREDDFDMTPMLDGYGLDLLD